MSNIRDMKLNPQDMLERMSTNVLRSAYDRGLTLSSFLEQQNPEHEYKDGLDAFQRLLQLSGIRTSSVPEIGLSASTWEEFNASPQLRVLAYEWAARTWRGVAMGGKKYHTRDLYSGAFLPGSINNPTYEDTDPRYVLTSPAIPISEIVRYQRGITGPTYTHWYLTTPAAGETRMVRVAEFADIPTATLTGADRTLTLYKTGRGIKQSYEGMRYQPIDMIAIWLEFLAAQSEADKLTYLIDILVNGDGNSGTAATPYTQTGLDPGSTAGTLSLEAWLAFKMSLDNPRALTHILVTKATARKLMLLNTGNANLPLVNIQAASGFGSLTAINSQLGDNVRFGYTSDAPANTIVGFDARTALMRVFDIRGSIQEVETYAYNQSQGLYLTETDAFCCLIPGGNITLNIAA